MMIDQMIMEARSMGCSDIHITVGMPLMYRINGRLQNAQTNPSDGEIIAMLAELLTDEQRENLERHRCGFCNSYPGWQPSACECI